MLQRNILIVNKLGLHARAATKLVNTATQYVSEITIARPGEDSVDAKSIMSILLLGASQGTQLELTARGEDQQDALEAIVKIIENRFGEEE